MQAQAYQQALWAIGLRLNAATSAQIEQAIVDREIVQTWPIRGTLHFVSAENVKWMLELCAPRSLAADRRRLRQLELDERTLEHCAQIFHDALHGGRRLTRRVMMQLLAEARISPAGQRGYHILWYLAQTGLLCLGPMQGNEQTFVLLDEWVPAARHLSRAEALATLATCYFLSHGPATVDDFARWAGLTLADARSGIDSVPSGLLVSDQQDARQYWWAADMPDAAPHDLPDAHLLPGFDEYVLGYKDRSDVLATEHAGKVVPGGNGVFLPTVVVDGQVVGTWKRLVGKNAVALSLSPFAPRLGVSDKHIAEAARRFSEFIGLPLSSVAVAGH